MDIVLIIGMGIGIVGVLLTIYFGTKNRRLKEYNLNLRKQLVECKQTCSNVCRVNVNKY